MSEREDIDKKCPSTEERSLQKGIMNQLFLCVSVHLDLQETNRGVIHTIGIPELLDLMHRIHSPYLRKACMRVKINRLFGSPNLHVSWLVPHPHRSLIGGRDGGEPKWGAVLALFTWR